MLAKLRAQEADGEKFMPFSPDPAAGERDPLLHVCALSSHRAGGTHQVEEPDAALWDDLYSDVSHNDIGIKFSHGMPSTSPSCITEETISSGVSEHIDVTDCNEIKCNLISAAPCTFRGDLDLACIQFFDHNAFFRAGVAEGAAEIIAIGRLHLYNREFAEALSAFQQSALLLPHDTNCFEFVLPPSTLLGSTKTSSCLANYYCNAGPCVTRPSPALSTRTSSRLRTA